MLCTADALIFSFTDLIKYTIRVGIINFQYNMGRKRKGCFSRIAILDSVKGASNNAEENDSEVFVDKKEEENENETDELTRLMSLVEIDEDTEDDDVEKLLSLAAFQQFLVSLPPQIHPAVKGHLVEKFKGLVEFPAQPSLERFSCISTEMIKKKLNILSEKAGLSFSLILAPPTSHCLKVLIT